jgi:hypothetical protein
VDFTRACRFGWGRTSGSSEDDSASFRLVPAALRLYGEASGEVLKSEKDGSTESGILGGGGGGGVAAVGLAFLLLVFMWNSTVGALDPLRAILLVEVSAGACPLW